MEDAKLGFEEVRQYANGIVKYSDDRIMILDGPHSFEQTRIYTDAYLIALCTKGSAQLKQDEGEDIEVGPQDVIMCHPDQFFDKVRTSLDFWCKGVLIASEYFEQLLLVCSANVMARKCIGLNPVIHFTAEEADEVVHDFEYLKYKMRSSLNGEHRTEMMDNLLQSIIFSSGDIMKDKVMPADGAIRFSSAQALVNNFIALLEKEAPKIREVRTYADMLCVTPKYLSAVCRRETGQTARDMISAKVSKRIRMLLSDPDLSVKQVARMCGFENLSFFGKYVKREFGISPRGLRMEK